MWARARSNAVAACRLAYVYNDANSLRVHNYNFHFRKFSSESKMADKAFTKWLNGVEIELLTTTQRKIHEEHMQAMSAKSETYKDPQTGYDVITVLAHLKRGNCCGNCCRHCPYDHVNAAPMYKGMMNYNSAFYN